MRLFIISYALADKTTLFEISHEISRVLARFRANDKYVQRSKLSLTTSQTSTWRGEKRVMNCTQIVKLFLQVLSWRVEFLEGCILAIHQYENKHQSYANIATIWNFEIIGK